MKKYRSNYDHRPYDIAMPVDFLRKVKDRRRNPTGKMHDVKTTIRNEEQVNVYPWKKLELGDFFIVRCPGREHSLRVSFSQAAARHDIEIVIRPAEHPDGGPALRVTCTVIGVKQWKRKAIDQHELQGYEISDGQWKARRRAKIVQDRREGRVPGTRSPRSNPFWVDDGQPEATTDFVDPTSQPGYVPVSNRDAAVALALAKALESK